AELLERRGYRVTSDQDKTLQNTPLYNVYAVRRAGRGDVESRPHPDAVGQEKWSNRGALLRELQSFLSERLPDYMVPSSVVLLDEMPLTTNGKLDVRALPAPDRTHFASEGDDVAPRTEAERILAGIWMEVLGLEKIGVNDNFFKIGGDSII